MISFDHIEDPNWFYRLHYPIGRLLHNRIFYRRFDVRGRENLPPEGVPYMLVCNHQNGLNDAMAMLFAQNDRRRRPVFIARADIFQNPLAARALYKLRIMPAFRVRDTGVENLGENDAIFERASEILQKGGVVAMFPEAVAQRGHWLGGFKKGFSRIAFRAEEEAGFKLGLQIVPMGHHYSDYQHVQSRMCISFGKPFGIADLKELYEENPQKAHLALCKRAQEAVRELMLDLPQDGTYADYDALRRQASDLMNRSSQRPFYRVLDREREAVAEVQRLEQTNPLEARQRLAEARAYRLRAERLRLNPSLCCRRLSNWQILLRTLELLLLAPFAALGCLAHLLTFAVIELGARLTSNPVLKSSFRQGIGLFAFNLNYVLLAVAAGLAFGWWGVLVSLLCTIPLLWSALRFRMLSEEYWQQIKQIIRQ